MFSAGFDGTEPAASQAMRLPWVWVLLAGVPVILASWMLALAGLSLREPPRPLFTPADLPALPPANENGWTEIPSALGQEPPRIDVAIVKRWDAIELRVAEWKEVLSQGPGMGVLGFAHAFGRAHFQETDGGAAPVVVLQTMKLLTARALIDATEGRCEAATNALVDLNRAACSIASEPRTMVGYIVGVTALELTLESTARVSEKCPVAAHALTEERALLAQASISGRSAVVGEYLQLLELTESVARPILFDRFATRQMLNERIMGLEHRAPPPVPMAKRLGWWIHNPIGKLAIDATWIQLDEYLVEAQDTLSRLRAAE